MKKEKSLTILSRRFTVSVLFVFGFLIFGTSSAFAQSPNFTKRIDVMTQLRDTFAPGTAKYDIVQDAVDYLEVLESNFNSNPSYLADLEASTGQDPFTADIIRKTHPIILANYSPADLAFAQQVIAEGSNGGVLISTPATKKAQWVIEANAY